MWVRDCCKRSVKAVAPGDTARALAKRMDREDVGCLVVVEDERPIGIVTDRDLALALLCGGRDAGALKARDVATRTLVAIREDAPISDAFHTLRQNGLRRLPVVDAAGRLTGILTADDLLLAVTSQLAGLGAVLSSQISGQLVAAGG
jgi:CBS domain-containing protein